MSTQEGTLMPNMPELGDSPPEQTRGPDCHVGAIVAEAPDVVVEWLRRWLLDRKAPTSWIERELRAAGYHLSVQTTRRHRQGLCNACRVHGRTWAVSDE